MPREYRRLLGDAYQHRKDDLQFIFPCGQTGREAEQNARCFRCGILTICTEYFIQQCDKSPEQRMDFEAWLIYFDDNILKYRPKTVKDQRGEMK